MAVFKSLRNPFNGTALVIEDPCPGSTTLYIQNEGFDKNSLTPLHDVGLNLNATRGQISYYDVVDPFVCITRFQKGRIRHDKPP